jgi:3'(2'), 5'-bisphosphate nucleotidase
MLEREIETATRLARLAGETILRHYEAGFVPEQKIGADDFSEPVTVADREASRIIVDGLSAAFPEDGILSEEEKDDAELRLTRGRVWIIDPIDGTAGYIAHDGDFAVHIGLAEAGVPIAGVVYLPFHDELSYAVKGGGAFGVPGGSEPIKLQTSDKRDLGKITMAVSRHHRSPRMSKIIEQFGSPRVVSRGSVGLKVGLITEQICDVYVSPGARTKLWDTCAPQIILEEAGGRFTDLFGMELRYDQADLQNRNGLLATNGAVHDAAVERLKPLLKEFGRVPYPKPHKSA